MVLDNIYDLFLNINHIKTFSAVFNQLQSLITVHYSKQLIAVFKLQNN